MSGETCILYLCIDIMKGNEMIVVTNSVHGQVHVNEFDSDGMKISKSIFINNGNDKISFYAASSLGLKEVLFGCSFKG